MKAILGLLLSVTLLDSCSPGADTSINASGGVSNASGATSVGGNTSATTQSIGGSGAALGGAPSTASSGTAMNQDATAGCAVWPVNKLFPYVGVRFYGPDSGPCSVTTASGVLQTFSYDTAGKPLKAASADNTTVWAFTYTNDLVTGETDTSPSASDVTITYQYGASSASYTQYTNNSTTPPFTATYELDARGYPQLVVMSAVSGSLPANWPLRYVYSYDSCHMTQRIAYNPDGSVNSESSLQYSYDSRGHLVRAFSPTGTVNSTYDYSCWAH